MFVRGRAGGQLPARTRLKIGWWGWLSVWTAVGLAIRVGTVLGRPHRVPGGDAYFYHYAANLLASGKGFINPFLYYQHTPHQVVKAAATFPPGFVLVLTAAALVGFKSFFAQRIWCCIIGAIAIAVCGVTGREIAGRRVGLIAAFLVAVYPNIWMNDELAMSEALSPLIVAVVLLTVYRFWKRPGWKSGIWLGLSVGVATLTRDELSLLGLFVVIPVVLLARALTWRRRLAVLAVTAVAALAVVAPWVGYNMTRFKDPVFISTGLGVTLASANCHETYYGPFEGYWAWDCALRAPISPNVDESVQGAQAQKYAMRYIDAHPGRLVVVELARVGRAFGLFRPIQQIRLDSGVETRPYNWALTGLAMYYCLALLSVGGVAILRRRRVPVYPLLAVGLAVLVTITLAFGNTRYRSTFEVSLVILAAVQVDWFGSRLADWRRGRAGSLIKAGGPEPPNRREPSMVGLPGEAG
jgi:4-amino-4-deoxy-L-arabinose transferase-like glycosyltransferase